VIHRHVVLFVLAFGQSQQISFPTLLFATTPSASESGEVLAKDWRFTVLHTPTHASWLNPAEIEVSLWSSGTSAPIAATADARRVFGNKQSATHGSKHQRADPWCADGREVE
jgi:hypothetical protein